jgi:hypothetical protein
LRGPLLPTTQGATPLYLSDVEAAALHALNLVEPRSHPALLHPHLAACYAGSPRQSLPAHPLMRDQTPALRPLALDEVTTHLSLVSDQPAVAGRLRGSRQFWGNSEQRQGGEGNGDPSNNSHLLLLLWQRSGITSVSGA